MCTRKININSELENLENAGLFSSNETTHSRVLAYFLQNNTDFLKKILEDEKIKIKVNNYDTIDVEPETAGRKDIVIKNDDFILVIENKYKDRNRENQLQKYETDIKAKYPNRTCKFIYLRPFMHELEKDCTSWHLFTYREISKMLKEIKNYNEAEKNFIERYIKIIDEKVYGIQAFCISCLKEALECNDIIFNTDNSREDIDGYSLDILLKEGYKSFLQFESQSPFEAAKGKLTISLTVKKEDKTAIDYRLLKEVRDKLGYKKIRGDKNYAWISEQICSNKNFSKDEIKEKIKNSKIVECLKNKNILART